jgi:signal transduction histidine kinase
MAHEECPMAIALREGRTVRGYEAIAERPDGSRAAFVPYPTVIRDRRGALVGAINVLVDVTEQRRVEDALRTATAVKDEFMGLVSHELRTPVTTIFGNARLLRDRLSLPEPQAAMVADIAIDAERLLGVVENLLLLTRGEAVADLDPEPQVLAHVLRRLIASHRQRNPARTITIDAEPRHLIVEADRTYLELLVGNLLGNADKYSPITEPIEIVVRAVDSEAHVTVLDRGIGIDGEDEARVFGIFYRSDAARRVGSGLGIGLSACRLVVTLLGGRIWGHPRPGGGSEFGFALPLAPEVVD